AAVCLHCGTALDAGRPDTVGAYCCVGCKVVHGLLTSQHLDRYYALRGERGVPVADAGGPRRDAKWLDAIESRLAAETGAARVDLDVQGLHCSACVWLLETLFARCAHAARI